MAMQIAETIPHIVWMATPDGGTTYLNRQALAYQGHSEPPSNAEWLSLIHPGDAEQAAKGWGEAVSSGTDYSDEYRIRRYDGEYRWHVCRARAMRDDHGDIELWVGTVTDVHERRVLERSLRDSEQQAALGIALLRSIDSAGLVGFKLVDRNFRILRINERLARASGGSPEEQTGRTVAEVAPYAWPQVESFYIRALEGEVIADVDVVTPDPEDPEQMRYWLTSYYPVRVDGEIVGVGNAAVDITVRRKAQEALERNVRAIVQTIATTVEYRDPYTAGHQRRVAEIAAAIAAELGMDAASIEGIRTAASIHDIGKISIPAEILSKPGRLSPIEFSLIKEHSIAGYNIVAGIDFPWPVAQMIRQHHERIDGSGYPDGLRGAEILLGARVIGVADVVEAMMSHRPYRPELGVDVVFKQIREDAGVTLDANVVEACIDAYAAGRLPLVVAAAV